MMMILAFEGCHPFRDGNGGTGARGGGPGSCFSGCSKRHSLAHARYSVTLCLILQGGLRKTKAQWPGSGRLSLRSSPQPVREHQSAQQDKNRGNVKISDAFLTIPGRCGEDRVKTRSQYGHFWPTPIPGQEQWGSGAHVPCHIAVVQ